MKKFDLKSVLIYIGIALLLISLSFGISYAFFTVLVSGNEDAKHTKVTTGTLSVDFTMTNRINNSNIMLIQDSERTTKAESVPFTVANNGNVAGSYIVYLSDLTISNNLLSEDFKWELVKNNTITYSGDFTSAVSGTLFPLTSTTQLDGSLSPVAQNIAVNGSDSYVLRIWLSETEADQTSLLGGTFSAKVDVVATQQLPVNN